MNMCMCACIGESERERERGTVLGSLHISSSQILTNFHEANMIILILQMNKLGLGDSYNIM